MDDELEDFEQQFLDRATAAIREAILAHHLPKQYAQREISQAIKREELQIFASTRDPDELVAKLSYYAEGMDDAVEGKYAPLSQWLWQYPDCQWSQADMILAAEASVEQMKRRFQEEFGVPFEPGSFADRPWPTGRPYK